ncbi:MAG: BlaI/MecI/CopY family transcriptional regulator [Lachnospiraceae bacterium]|nr:BlaI/MecI/CopY family transcriptional regulator [Robinsoniella sp.]MDY3767907.1 BlaI/MecI/CopY family transcriptional regulator [Lachnospiraceae bacterium]
MSPLKAFQKFTNRDLDILSVLWNSPEPLTATQIVETNPTLNMNTVQAILRKLLKNQFIEVSDIVYSGTVLARRYKPAISGKEFALYKLTSEYKQFGKDLPKSSLMATLLEEESDKERLRQDIDQMKKVLEDMEKEL